MQQPALPQPPYFRAGRAGTGSANWNVERSQTTRRSRPALSAAASGRHRAGPPAETGNVWTVVPLSRPLASLSDFCVSQ